MVDADTHPDIQYARTSVQMYAAGSVTMAVLLIQKQIILGLMCVCLKSGLLGFASHLDVHNYSRHRCAFFQGREL